MAASANANASATISMRVGGAQTPFDEIAKSFQSLHPSRYLLIIAHDLESNNIAIQWHETVDSVGQAIIASATCSKASDTHQCFQAATAVGEYWIDGDHHHYFKLFDSTCDWSIEGSIYHEDSPLVREAMTHTLTSSVHTYTKMTHAPGGVSQRPYYGTPLPTRDYCLDVESLFGRDLARSCTLHELGKQLYAQHVECPLTIFVQSDSFMRTHVGISAHVDDGISSFTYSMGCSATAPLESMFDIPTGTTHVTAKVKYRTDDLWWNYDVFGVRKNLTSRLRDYHSSRHELVLPCNTVQLFDFLNFTRK